MSLEGVLSIVSSNSSSIKATIWFGPMRAKESSIWLLYLLSHPNFLERCAFKLNTLGRIKCTFQLKKRSDLPQLLEDTKLTVATLITRNERLNTS